MTNYIHLIKIKQKWKAKRKEIKMKLLDKINL